ncbi:hypothetical protein DFS34DRAFT_577191 [Phlyctochytrium arcticum]|nr:hypothetical protein DFS34DRAFT_577191 [Phlyctochytrium arcticum]
MDEFRSKRVRVFRNGDIYEPGKKLVINTRVYRNFEQFLARLSDELSLVNGAVRKVYSLDGHLVKTLDDLKDGAVYVASGGEHFKRVPYLLTADIPTSALPPSNNSANTAPEILPRKENGLTPLDVQEVKKKEKERPIFGPTSKAYKVTVFVNGDNTSSGLKMILNYRNCRTFEQLFRNLTELLRMSVRKLYDAFNGHRITRLVQIRDGMNLVAAVGEPFRAVNYHLDENPNAAHQMNFHNEDDTPKIVTFFPNGDPYNIGQTVTVTKKKFPNFQRVGVWR